MAAEFFRWMSISGLSVLSSPQPQEGKKMAWVFRAVVILLAIVLSACSAVYTTAPVGDTAVQLISEEWQGTWLGDEVVVVTTVLDREKGLLQVAWIERSMDGAILETQQSYIRSSGDFMFASARDKDAEEPRYIWIRVDRSQSKLITWAPNLKTFQTMVREGRFPGTVNDDGVMLGELTPQQLEMINTPSSDLLDWEEPRVFIRIAD